MSLTDNILDVFNRADSEVIEEGKGWYAAALVFAASLDSPIRSAGIISALSARNGWGNNKNKAAQLYAQNGDGTGVGMSMFVNKAIRIYNGEPALDVLTSDKQNAFYRNIMGDYSYVTVDGHAYDLAMGRVHTMKERAPLKRKGEYDRFSRAYRSAAFSVGLLPAELQAITWLQWRNETGYSNRG